MTTPAPLGLPLNETGQVILDGAGNGTLRMYPDGSHEHWQPALASVKVATAIAEAQCRIYAGPTPTDDNFIDGTLSGSTGDSTDRVSSYDIARTRTPYLWAVWTGGDPGAQATMVVNGTKTIQ
jgi:hypothetical protein